MLMTPVSFQPNEDSRGFPWHKEWRGKNRSEVIFFLLARWGCTLSYVSCASCILCKSGKLNDDCAGNLPRQSHCKPGNIDFSLLTYPPCHCIPEKGLKHCLAVFLSYAVQRKSHSVKSEKADRERHCLVTCLVMLWHEVVARPRERKGAVLSVRRYTPCFASISESSASQKKSSECVLVFHKPWETCPEVKLVVSCYHVIPHTALHHSACWRSHSFSSETRGWVCVETAHTRMMLISLSFFFLITVLVLQHC